MLTPPEIRAARKMLGMTQDQLANALGLTRNTVAKWECALGDCTGPAAILIQRLVKEVKDRNRARAETDEDNEPLTHNEKIRREQDARDARENSKTQKKTA